MGKSNRTKHEDIVLANLDLLKTLPNLEFDGFYIDASQEVERLTRTCWACGAVGKRLKTRAHVIAKSQGGQDTPDNYFLLCDVCHDEQPDGLSREIQEKWLLTRENQLTLLCQVALGFHKELCKVRPETTVESWMNKMGSRKIQKIIAEGYASAASWKNGRSNVLELLKHSLRMEKA